MFFVYILQSQKNGRYYIGYSEEPERRLGEHNSGKVISTKPFRPWVKVYAESFSDELSAIRREKEIKQKKSRRYIDWLIGSRVPIKYQDG
jgi:putative endonuclease